MTTPAVSTASAPAPSATDFEQDVGEFFGDYSSPDVTPEPAASAAGTTPAEPAPGTEAGTDLTAPKAGDDPAASPSAGTTPAAATPVVEDDPFKDSTPATYVVNGQTVTSEDIRVFKEGGAVIRQESLPNVLSKLAERDSLAEKFSARDREYQTLAKVAEWTDSTTNKTYSGPEAAIEMRIGNASLVAENQLIIQAITDPDILARCLTTAIGKDGKERVVFSEAALDDMRRENALNQREIAMKVRDHYRGVMAEASKPQPAAIDFPKATDALVGEIAKLATLDASLLSAEDRTVLAEQLPFHIKEGMASVAWQNLAKRMMASAAANKTNAAQIASVTTKATLDGAARMAAAARGMKQTPNAPAVVTPKAPTPQQERATSEGDMYDAQERAAAAAIRRSA